MKQLRISLIFFILFLFFTASPGICNDPADVLAVPATGSSQINKSDITSAKNNAVKNAISRSLETALFQITAPENLSSFKVIDSVISGDTSPYIRDFKVIGENTSGRDYRVIIKSNVIKSKLYDVLRASGIENEDSAPKVLILLSEKHEPAGQPFAWWTDSQGRTGTCFTEATSVLMSRKISSVDISGPKPADATGKPLTVSATPSIEEALILARHYRADFILMGTVTVSEQASSQISGGLRSFPAKAEAKIIKVSDGSEIASASETASVINSDSPAGTQQAAVQAARQISTKLAQAISESRGKNKEAATPAPASAFNTIPVTINGQDILGKIIPIRKAMKSIKGIRDVKTLEMNYSNAKLQASYEGDAHTLSKELALQNIDSLKMDIQISDETGIVINIPEQKAQ
jgi:hypothetical protein